jgi:hypothetical protein
MKQVAPHLAGDKHECTTLRADKIPLATAHDLHEPGLQADQQGSTLHVLTVQFKREGPSGILISFFTDPRAGVEAGPVGRAVGRGGPGAAGGREEGPNGKEAGNVDIGLLHSILCI